MRIEAGPRVQTRDGDEVGMKWRVGDPKQECLASPVQEGWEDSLEEQMKIGAPRGEASLGYLCPLMGCGAGATARVEGAASRSRSSRLAIAGRAVVLGRGASSGRREGPEGQGQSRVRAQGPLCIHSQSVPTCRCERWGTAGRTGAWR